LQLTYIASVGTAQVELLCAPAEDASQSNSPLAAIPVSSLVIVFC
jgi:hypothetical protein